LECVKIGKMYKSNLKVIEILEEWLSEPDDLGEELWDEFDKGIESDIFLVQGS
jgi:hypothetical protein